MSVDTQAPDSAAATMTEAPKVRKKRDTSRKRAEIISAAMRAFQEEGYDSTSMDRIAEVAGASKRTVYNHFASKEQLFGAVIEECMLRAKELKSIEYDGSLPLETQLVAFTDAKLSLIQDPEWMGIIKVGLGVLVRDPEAARSTMESTWGEDHLVTWLEAAHADGRLDVPNPARAAELFWGTVSGAFFWPLLLGKVSSAKEIEALRQEFVRSFIAAYRQGS